MIRTYSCKWSTRNVDGSTHTEAAVGTTPRGVLICGPCGALSGLRVTPLPLAPAGR